MDVEKLDPAGAAIRSIKTSQAQDRDLNLNDVLKLAEVMVGSMRGFFAHLDTSMYHELNDIAEFINETKTEIRRLQPADLKEKDIPQAGRELEAIVEATENATNTIMEQAEVLLEADPEDSVGYQEKVSDAALQILEACSFQDITGQRISKVVFTLQRIEERIGSLAVTLGDRLGSAVTEETDAERRRREQMLHGPALAGEGVNQDDIDDMFSSDSEIDQNDIDSLFD
ncbi:MAG: protein phosphatase CheZ [Parvibaculaceae bacterium]|nr:protein phosphatase CheZ [Parvibaculaceae bacterium]